VTIKPRLTNSPLDIDCDMCTFGKTGKPCKTLAGKSLPAGVKWHTPRYVVWKQLNQIFTQTGISLHDRVMVTISDRYRIGRFENLDTEHKRAIIVIGEEQFPVEFTAMTPLKAPS